MPLEKNSPLSPSVTALSLPFPSNNFAASFSKGKRFLGVVLLFVMQDYHTAVPPLVFDDLATLRCWRNQLSLGEERSAKKYIASPKSPQPQAWHRLAMSTVLAWCGTRRPDALRPF